LSPGKQLFWALLVFAVIWNTLVLTGIVK
jgi:hypothetical protein